MYLIAALPPGHKLFKEQFGHHDSSNAADRSFTFFNGWHLDHQRLQAAH